MLTKTDLLPPESRARDLDALRRAVGALNPGATLLDRADATLTGDAVFSLAAFDPSGKPPDVLAWLSFEAADAVGRGLLDHGSHASHHHHHDPSRHGDDIRAYCLAFERPLTARGFWFAFEMLQAHYGSRLLRIKGLAALDDAPDEPVVVHAVHHVLSPPKRLPDWPSADRRTRLVVIAQDVPEDDLRRVFALFQTAPSDRLSDRPSAVL